MARLAGPCPKGPSAMGCCLSLPGLAEAEPALRAYLASIQGYQENHYKPNGEVIDKVKRHWGFVFDQWGYTQVC